MRSIAIVALTTAAALLVSTTSETRPLTKAVGVNAAYLLYYSSYLGGAGDELAGEILTETAELLAIWLGNLVDVLEPDVVVVGGGVGKLISHFFGHILQQLPKFSINQRCSEIPLKLARYCADSGIAGAGALCSYR